MAVYQNTVLVNNFYIPIGFNYVLPAAAIFQIGAAGTPLEPGAPNAMQYQGNIRMNVNRTTNNAKSTVEFMVSFRGTGPLIGPIAGLLT